MADEILKNIEMLPDEVEFVSDIKAIVYTAKAKAYQAAERLMLIADEDDRDWYMREAALEGWSVRTWGRAKVILSLPVNKVLNCKPARNLTNNTLFFSIFSTF